MNNNTFNIGNFNADNSAINLGGTVEGDQIVTQYTFPDPKQTEATRAVSDLLQDLHQRYPQATDAEILAMIEKGFATMQQTNPQKWRKWVDVFSVVFAGGLEAVKVVAPGLGIPIEVGKRLYEISDRNRKQLPGN